MGRKGDKWWTYPDKFANPTNPASKLGHARVVSETGKRSAPCHGCGQWRWFEPESLELPDSLCDLCLMHGRPRYAPNIDQRGGLTLAQRTKKGHSQG